MPKRPSKFTATEFGGSPDLVQPATTPDGKAGHTPDASEKAMLLRRGDPEGVKLPPPGDEEAELSWYGLEKLTPTQKRLQP